LEAPRDLLTQPSGRAPPPRPSGADRLSFSPAMPRTATEARETFDEDGDAYLAAFADLVGELV